MSYLTLGEQMDGTRWLETERRWLNRVGPNWEAKGVLGRGGQGIVGLWVYNGPDRDEKALKEVVVKQAVGARSRKRLNNGLNREAAALEAFKASGSPHIIKMYRHLYRELGFYTMSLDEGVVHRMFLEYCPGGDLVHWLQKKMKSKTTVTELEMWAIFHCLARGAMVMHTGTEDPSLPRWDKEIVHFDIKFGNTLVGPITTDNEHKDLPIFKFGDFGLAVNVPPVQDSKYQEDHSYWGTYPFYAPEQRKRYIADIDFHRPWVNSERNLLNTFTYGCHTNIWQIGILMWCLKHMKFEPQWQTIFETDYLDAFQSDLSNRLINGGLTLGSKNDIGEESDGSLAKYSIGLNALIKECLLIQPPSRPSPQVLFTRTKRGLEIYHKRTGKSLSPVLGPIAAQPSARWFSQDPHPPVDNSHIPLPTLKISELIKKVERAKREERENTKFLGIVRRGWASRLHPRRRNDQVGGSAQGFLPQGGGLPIGMPNFLPSSPFGLGAGVAANIGAGLGAGLGMVRDQLQAGVNAGAHRLADAIIPPPPPTLQRNDEWEVLSKGKGRALTSSEPLPPEEAIVPLPEIACIIRMQGFLGGPTHTHLKLKGLFKGTTILQLKGKLQASGVDIPLDKMKVTCGRKGFEDTDVLAELDGRTVIRLEVI